MGSFITTFTPIPSMGVLTSQMPQVTPSTVISISAIWYGKTTKPLKSAVISTIDTSIIPTATDTPEPQLVHSSPRGGTIAGLTVLGIIIASVIFWGTWFFRRRRTRKLLTPRPLQSLPPTPEHRPLTMLSQSELERVLILGPPMRESKVVPQLSLPTTSQPESSLPTTPLEPSPISHLPSPALPQPSTSIIPAVDPFAEPPPASAPTPATRRQRKAAPRPAPPAPYATALQSSRTTIGQLTEEQMAVIEHLMARNVPAGQVVELIDRMTSGAAVGGSDTAPEEAPPEYTRRA